MIKTITFICRDRKLTGTLHLPDTFLPPAVIGAHGLLGTQDSGKQVALARACSAAGMAYLRFDHRGCGKSAPAEPGSDLLADRTADLIAAVSWARECDALGDRIGLFGSSMGGAACLSAAPVCSPAAVVIWAAPVISDSVNRHSAEASLPPGWTLRPFDLTGHLAGIHHICVCHGDRDAVVPVDNARTIHAGAGAPKKLIIFNGAGHRMSQPAHQRQFTADATGWFTRYLLSESAPSGTRPDRRRRDHGAATGAH